MLFYPATADAQSYYPPFIKHHKVAMFIRNVLHSHGKNHLNLYKIEMVVYDRNVGKYVFNTNLNWIVRRS